VVEKIFTTLLSTWSLEPGYQLRERGGRVTLRVIIPNIAAH